MVALPPAVQPDGHQCQQRQPLLAKLKVHAEELNGVHKPAQQLHVDPVQRCQLPQQTPPLAPVPVKKVEDEHSQHTGTVVVHHAQRAQHRARRHHKGGYQQIRPCFLLFVHRFHQMDAQNAQQQRPDDVLVHRVEPCTAVHQIEGHFRKQGKQQQPQSVFFQVVGVEIALHRHKGKDGKGHTSRTGQPFLCRQQRRPQVIHQHQRHSKDMKSRCAQVKAGRGSWFDNFCWHTRTSSLSKFRCSVWNTNEPRKELQPRPDFSTAGAAGMLYFFRCEAPRHKKAEPRQSHTTAVE